MIIKSVKLNNIRSYLNETINFPEGSVLLSGDIGSGKSTILLAMEFALFGMRRKGLSGSSLLRKGKKEGSVELCFSIDGKDIIIKRNLKTVQGEVRQDSGYILIDGMKTEGTAVELKSKMLEILGYPKELVSKSSDLVYRYTVYTPQEEMKQILADDKDARLDTLRRVFGIDRYKKIRENTQIFVRKLKETRKEYEGKISGLDEKSAEKNENEKRLNSIKEKISALNPEIKLACEKLLSKKEQISSKEGEIKLLNELRKQIDVTESELSSRLLFREKNKKLLESAEKQADELNAKIRMFAAHKTPAENEKKEIKEKITKARDGLDEASLKIKECEINRKNASEINEKIKKLSTCPTCLQAVDESHKKEISTQKTSDMQKIDELLKECAEKKRKWEEELKKHENKFDNLLENEKKSDEKKHILALLDEKNKGMSAIKSDLEEAKKEISRINANKIKLNEKMLSYKNIDDDYSRLKEELEKLQHGEKELAVRNASLLKEAEGVKSIIDSLEKDIAKKEKAKQKLNSIKELQNWLEAYFTNLVLAIEKQVMSTIYRNFNELLERWFDILIEDETTTIRLDDEFTPIIEQNGYEVDIADLSGGEKTSCALAYRLALNKVINDFIGTIQTKELIILDEPTDGFSTEQLDKVRDVLEQINMKQVIVVSHESKIETFVDSIIKIGKNEHVSNIVS